MIDRPIYLLGTQGGGLTLLSRILHRHPDTLSVTGNSLSWAGDDETQNVLQDILPECLTWRKVSVAGYNSEDHNWLYANDAFLQYYRESGDRASPELAQAYQSILRSIISLNRLRSMNGPGRFVDKSQSLTVRVALVRKLLRDCNPRFVLITRNPFAMTWRAVTKDAVVSNLEMSKEEKLKVAVQHWKNSMKCALADGTPDDLGVWRFEDLLADPGKIVSEICAHAELSYRPEILPQPNDEVPWGSMFDAFNRKKWYPLRSDVSAGYLRDIPEWAVRHVDSECGALLDRFGYDRSTGTTMSAATSARGV